MSRRRVPAWRSATRRNGSRANGIGCPSTARPNWPRCSTSDPTTSSWWTFARSRSASTRAPSPGRVHAPRGMLEFWADPAMGYYREFFDADKELILHCAGGQRSVLAAIALQEMGYPRVAHLDVGFDGWAKAGQPVEDVAHDLQVGPPALKPRPARPDRPEWAESHVQNGYSASVSSVWRRTLAPAVMSAGAVYSAMLWDRPPTLGVKIIAVGTDAGEHLGVVAGTARQPPGGVTEPLRRGLDQIDGGRIEPHRLEPGQRPRRDGHALGVGQLGEHRGEAGLGLAQHRLVRVAEVHRQQRRDWRSR